MDKPICRNATEIGQYLGIDKRSVPYFKEKYGLPVFRFEEKGNWKGLKSSLNLWLEDMEKTLLDSHK